MVIAATQRSVARLLDAEEASSPSVVAEWVDIVGLVRSSISDYLRWTDDERVPGPVVTAVLVTGTAEAATDSASGEARADPGAVHTQLLDAFVDN